MNNINLINKLILGDCLEVMKEIDDKSVDLILCDLPYGTTACKWDIIIPFDKLWGNYHRIIKDNGTILLFGIEPFSSYLRLSNIKYYRYDWVWDKKKAGNFVLGNKMPLKVHELISVFYKNLPTYNPQKTDAIKKRSENPITHCVKNNSETAQTASGDIKYSKNYEQGKLLPTSIQSFSKEYGANLVHPTQKPVVLCEYLIKTYTQENDLVLDNCFGSGSTLVAAKNLNRQFIGIEKEEKYFNIAKKRLEDVCVGSR